MTTQLDVEQWASTPLGDPAAWPEALRSAADTCLQWPTPCAVLWGPQSRLVYNDLLIPGLGVRHPGARGRSMYEVLPEMWPTVGPILHEVVRTGRPFRAARFPLPVERSGERLWKFFSLVYSPIFDGEKVGGVFCPFVDDTASHLTDRHRLAQDRVENAPDDDVEALVRVAVREYAALDDVRFAVVYLPDPAAGTLRRSAAAGAVVRSSTAQSVLDSAVASGRWPLAVVLDRTGEPVRVPAGPASPGPRPLWEGAWLAALPDSAGVLALGLDHRVAISYDEREFVASCAAVLGRRFPRREHRLTGS